MMHEHLRMIGFGTRPSTQLQSKGVKTDNVNGVNENIIIIGRNDKPMGVRKNENDMTLHYTHNKNQNQILWVNKPCVCGSVHHSKTTHSDCILNVQYDDYVKNY